MRGRNNTLESVLTHIKADENGCWNWQLQILNGYGYVSWRGRPRRVHRLIYELTRGPVPMGLPLDHLCRNRACCNPEHLEPVTYSENLLRSPLVRFNNGNAMKTKCVRGHSFDDSNTYYRPDGYRGCRTCKREDKVRYRAARRASVEVS